TTFGQELLAAAGYYIPIDERLTIEGRRADQGWIARKMNLKKFPVVAEGIYLAFKHSERTITTETPSEYDLAPRIQAHIAMIQRAIELSFLQPQEREGVGDRPEFCLLSTVTSLPPRPLLLVSSSLPDPGPGGVRVPVERVFPGRFHGRF